MATQQIEMIIEKKKQDISVQDIWAIWSSFWKTQLKICLRKVRSIGRLDISRLDATGNELIYLAVNYPPTVFFDSQDLACLRTLQYVSSDTWINLPGPAIWWTNFNFPEFEKMDDPEWIPYRKQAFRMVFAKTMPKEFPEIFFHSEELMVYPPTVTILVD